MPDILAMARAAGFAVILDGRIGSQEYHSVSGTVAALRHFGEAYSAELARSAAADVTVGAEENKT